MKRRRCGCRRCHVPLAPESGAFLNFRYVPAEAPVGLAAAVPSHAAIAGIALPQHPAVDARNLIHSLDSHRYPVPKQQQRRFF